MPIEAFGTGWGFTMNRKNLGGDGSTTPGEQSSFPGTENEKTFWMVTEWLRKLDSRLDGIEENLDGLTNTVRDIKTAEEAIENYEKKVKEETRDRRDFTFKIVMAILGASALITGIIKLL